MELILGGVGIVLLLVAGGCVAAALRLDGRLRVMSATPTLAARQIADLHRGRSYGRRCEVTGVIECDAPLSAPLSNTLCVAYRHEVAHSIEEASHTDSDDPFTVRSRQRTRVDAPDERRVRFWVRDETGRVQIDPAWAAIDMPRTEERYESTTVGMHTHRADTVGSWHTEEALPLGARVYVLGYLCDQHGEPTLACHPADIKHPFLISHRDERELTRATARRSNALYLAVGATSLLGLLMIGLSAYRLLWL